MSHELVSNPSSAQGIASSSNGQKTSPSESPQLPIWVHLLEYQKVVRCHRHNVRATLIQCWAKMSCPNLAVCHMDSLVPSCSRYKRSGSHTSIVS